MSSGHRMLVSFDGSRDIGREVADGRVPIWGGKLGRDGGHPIEQSAEKYLGGEPSQGGIVAEVGQDIKTAERLPPLELQLDLPAQVGRPANNGRRQASRVEPS